MTREPEWDDTQREAMLGLLMYRRQLCPGCDFHESLTADRSNHFTFEDKVCPVCKGAAQYGRMQKAEDDRALSLLGEKPSPLAARPSDGRITHIRRLSPVEVEHRSRPNTPE